MKLSLTNNSTTLTAVAFALAAAFVLLVFIPLGRAISAANRSLELKRSIILQEKSLLAQIELHQDEMEEVHKYTSRWSEAPNPNFHLSQLLGEISHLAKEAGTDALRLEPRPIVSMQSLHRIPVQVGLRGTFQEIHQFLQKLESLPHQLWLHRIELAPGNEDRQELTCTMEFEAFIASVRNSH